MSQAIGHAALGYGLTTGVLLALKLPKSPLRNNEFIEKNQELIKAGGAIWALLPDIHWLIPAPSLKAFHGAWWTDVFWFHRWIDTIDPADSVFISAVLLGFAGVTLIIYRLLNKSKTKKEK